MSTKSVFFFFYFFLFYAQVQAQNSPTKTAPESYYWIYSWIVNRPDTGALPSVLIIGDSHVERYQPVVAEQLKGRYYVSKITSSKSMGDPYFLKMLEAILNTNKFDFISFNNGLHGVKYSIDEYRKDIPKVYKILKKNNPNAKLLWVTTTARRIKDDLDSFDEYNNGVNERNDAVVVFCKKKSIQLIDFSSLSKLNKNYYMNDGIHFNEKGVKAQAQLIIDAISR